MKDPRDGLASGGVTDYQGVDMTNDTGAIALSSGDLAQLRSLLLSAADDLDSGWPAADLPSRLRAAADDLHTPESRARRDAMRARVAGVRQ